VICFICLLKNAEMAYKDCQNLYYIYWPSFLMTKGWEDRSLTSQPKEYPIKLLQHSWLEFLLLSIRDFYPAVGITFGDLPFQVLDLMLDV